MVVTRAQSQRVAAREADDDVEGRGRRRGRRLSDGGRPSAGLDVDALPSSDGEVGGSSALPLPPPPPPPPPARSGRPSRGSHGGLVGADAAAEPLGRGHRVSRPTRFLEEEYAAMQAEEAARKRARAARRRRSSSVEDREDSPVVQRRHAPREAALRALSRLQDTMNDAEGRGSSSASSVVSSGPEYRNKRGRRSPSSSAASAASSSSSSSPSRGRDSDSSSLHSSPVRHSHSPLDDPRNGGRRGGGGDAHHHNPRDRRAARAASANSSISDESMRDAATDALAREDERADRRLRGAPDSDTDSGPETVEAQERTLARAKRRAKHSTSRDVNINYYLREAVGTEDVRSARRRAADRRYRHLLMLDEERREDEAAQGSGGGGGGGGGGVDSGATAAGALGDISPLSIDSDVTFDSVGGLPGHLVALREMVLLPLLYPQLLAGMGLSPPRGVLFVGPPGTGKTLVARALAVEGSRFAEKKVTFFMRKGADILSKWVGESERQLKLLFEEARRQQPSIIFFDEIDGLAPTRHTKTEQTQAALVATLLALLDGLDDRGQVVVIGATNRPDTIDPALRRPGRFDRELIFPLPDAAARRHILGILTAKQNLATAAGEGRAALVEDLVRSTEGYSGADLKGLCMEAGLHRLRTALPQIYTSSSRLVLPCGPTSTALAIRREDFLAAARRLGPSMRRGGQEANATQMDEHVERLFRSTRAALLASLAAADTAVARALERERRDCSDLQSAVRQLSAFPAPAAPHGLVLFLTVAAEEGEGEGKMEGEVVLGERAGDDDIAASPLFSPVAGPRASAAARAVSLLHACVAVARALPSFHPLVVHLPQVRVSFNTEAGDGSGGGGGGAVSGEAAAGSPYAGRGFAGGHIYDLVQLVQRSAPCIVVLRGAEVWLQTQGLPEPRRTAADSGAEGEEEEEGEGREEPGEEEGEGEGEDAARAYGLSLAEYEARRGAMLALRYYLDLLADTEAMIFIPCVDDATRRALLGRRRHPCSPTAAAAAGRRGSLIGDATHTSALTRQLLPPHHALHPHFTVLSATVRAVPADDDLAAFVAHVHRSIALALHVQAAMAPAAPHGGGDFAPLAVDKTPTAAPPPSREARRAHRREALALWRKIDYRRLQLRHVLLQWVSQYISTAKYQPLLSGDLDLQPGTPIHKEWHRHTRRRGRIGLNDVLEKIELEEYACLSQFNDDIDLIARNVRTFFRSNAVADRRYRVKALDLKETTVLNMYKVNKNVVRFCELHRSATMPAFSDSEDDDRDGDDSGNSGGDGGEREGVAGDAAAAAALTFSQRPPQGPRRKLRIFGQRRRRRRPNRDSAPVGKKARPEGDGEKEKEKEKEEEGTPDSGSGSEATDSGHDEEEDAVVLLHGDVDDAAQPGSTSPAPPPQQQQPQPSPASPTYSADEGVEGWAVALLRGLTFFELHGVFQAVMRWLEAEVRRRDDANDAEGGPLETAGEFFTRSLGAAVAKVRRGECPEME